MAYIYQQSTENLYGCILRLHVLSCLNTLMIDLFTEWFDLKINVLMKPYKVCGFVVLSVCISTITILL